MKLTVLGARGSIPVDGPEFTIYGGGTSAYLLEVADQTIFLDAGSGLMNAPEHMDGQISILLTHPHLDHLMGLCFFRHLFVAGKVVTIYGAGREIGDVQQQVDHLFAPPLWPVMVESFPADLRFSDVKETFFLGEVRVDSMEAVHPGGCTVFRISYGGKSLVYATDFEHSGDLEKRLADFAKGCDLLIYDGQYFEEEYPPRAGYGHSTPETGLRIMEEAGAGRLLLTHHDPRHTDEMLAKRERELQALCLDAAYAKRLQVIEI
ncbi:MAG: MBL fold metallo-hydrolase [Lachnospiraceae bacterium]|nr:MBL fold metallo-hydrolase [Lachnospiraceae bacterium]